MSPEIIGLIGVVVLLVTMGMGMWIGMGMAVVGIAGIMAIRGWDQALIMAGGVPYQSISFYPISVMPMFILMGVVISNMGMGGELYIAAYKIVGQLRGGLAQATVLACAMLAAITGSAGTALIVMSQVALPEMRKYGYSDALATGIIASASTLGILIPPSLPFVMYGILTEQSVGKLFIAGILPGLLQAAVYMVVVYIWCKIYPKAGPAGPKTGFIEKVTSLRHTWSVVLLFVLVMGGIYGGIFTTTEAGALGAFGAILIAAVGRKVTWKNLFGTFRETGIFAGMIMITIAGTFLFMSFMATSKLPMAVGTWVAGLGVSNIVVVIAVIVMYLILGTALPEIPVVMLTIPIIYPMMKLLGFDPIWFGVIIIKVIEIGSLSPPTAMNIFMLSGITGVPVGTVTRGVLPFMLSDVIQVAILVALPQIATVLPNMMMK